MRRDKAPAMRVLVLLSVVALTLASCKPVAEPSSATRLSLAELQGLPDWRNSWTSTGGQLLSLGATEPPPGKIPAPPLTPKYQALVDEAQQRYGLGGSRIAYCLPVGMPGLLDRSNTFEFVFSPGRITMFFEDGEIRRIHTDGRAHPPADELYQNIQGHSIGRWDRDTLVVDTVGMSKEAELFVFWGLTVTPQTHIVERMYKRADNVLQIDTVVTDPQIFAQPYSYSKSFIQLGLDDFQPGCTLRDNAEEVDLTPPVFEALPP